MFSKKVRNFILPFTLLITFLILYIHNLSPSVYGGDVGDFVTSASVGGVAHAPGYPIFILLGFVLIHAFSFFTPAFAMGLISAFSGVGGIIVCYLIVTLLTKSRLSAVLTATMLGFSYLYWFYAEIAEVFALHSFLILLLFYFSFKFDITRKKKWLYWWAVVLGIASVTHQTIAFFIPSYILILFPGVWKIKKQIKVLLLTLGLIVLPWISYIYVFIASSHHPVINWDNVHDLSSFLQLILRKDYGTFTAGVFDKPILAQRIIILKSYLFTILTQLTIPTVVVSIVGIVALWFYSKRYAVACVLAFLISGPIFITYAGFPLGASFYFGVYERFFTMSTLSIFFLFGYGIFSIAKRFTSFFDRPLYFIVLQMLFFVIPLQLFLYNFPKTNLSQVWIGDTMSMDFLNPLPKGSLLLVGGDTQLFNTWYIHYARNIRPDIKLVNSPVVGKDPFVLKEEEKVKKSNPHVKGNELVAKTLEEIATKTPVYSLDQIQAPGKTKLTWVPTGMLYKLSLQDQPEDKPTYMREVESTLRQLHVPNFSGKNYKNLTIADIPQTYAKAMWAVGNYLQVNYQDTDGAIIYYKKAIAIDPTFDNAYTTIGLMYLTKNNNCLGAENNFKEAIEQKPYEEFPYFLLYTTYGECFHDKSRANSIVHAFNNEFKADFFKELALTLKSFKK